MTAHHTASTLAEVPIALTLLAIAGFYVRGHLQRPWSRGIQSWRAVSLLAGLFAIWIALSSPLSALDHEFLTVHMVQHLLLMSIAAPLILMGEPVLVLWAGLPLPFVKVVRRLAQRPSMRRLGSILVSPVWCWVAATGALAVWHVPAMLTLTMQSGAWHAIAKASFVVTGLLFWWPVVHPWPSARVPRWSMVLYLFLAMLPCDILSAFLVFSERIAYSVYLPMPGHTSLSVLDDQAVAGALMWTVVTLVYLTAGTILATRLLSPRALEAV